jgi:hypothetical protein
VLFEGVVGPSSGSLRGRFWRKILKRHNNSAISACETSQKNGDCGNSSDVFWGGEIETTLSYLSVRSYRNMPAIWRTTKFVLEPVTALIYK